MPPPQLWSLERRIDSLGDAQRSEKVIRIAPSRDGVWLTGEDTSTMLETRKLLIQLSLQYKLPMIFLNNAVGSLPELMQRKFYRSPAYCISFSPYSLPKLLPDSQYRVDQTDPLSLKKGI